MPELTELSQVEEASLAIDARLADTASRRDDAVRLQTRIEDDLSSVEARIAEVDRRLYSGSVTIPRELQAMQADRELLNQRRGLVEDEVLAAMGEREPLDGEVMALEAERRRLDGEGSRLRAAIAEAQVAIDAELAAEETRRAESASGLPADIVTLYERLRAKHGGVGAAPLAGGRCNGCYLTLPATEVDRIKHAAPDELVTCDQCGRILVRPEA